MSTNCLIGKKYGDNIKAIYCHHDGYPSYMYEMLNEYYTNDAIIDKLINLGDILSLKPHLEPLNGEKHSFEHPAPNVTIAYHRDRNEDKYIRQFSNKGSFLEELKDFGCNYLYLWDDSCWKMFTNNDDD